MTAFQVIYLKKYHKVKYFSRNKSLALSFKESTVEIFYYLWYKIYKPCFYHTITTLEKYEFNKKQKPIVVAQLTQIDYNWNRMLNNHIINCMTTEHIPIKWMSNVLDRYGYR